MPLYEYQCDACGHRFEQIQKFSDPHVEVCPNCGERQVKKLLSTPAIQFKGSGWYITDYARKGAGGDDKAAGDGKQGGDSKASADSKESGTKDKSTAADAKTSSPPTPPSSSSKSD